MAGTRPDRNIEISRGDNCWRGRFNAMASPCELLCELVDDVETQRLTELAATEAWRIEDKFSRYRRGNVIDRINCAEGRTVELDAETAALLDFSVTLHELSDHAFDITSGVLRRAWTFDGSANVPTPAEVSAVMDHVGWDKVTWRSPQLNMPAGMEIDLGGIGKEYAVDRVATLLRQQTSSSCLVNLGGDLAVTTRPQSFDAWHVGIESLATDSRLPANMLSLKVGALATSGDARRYLLKDGVRYGHILDPRTGWPIADAPRSVTVAVDTCTQAGMLCTLAMLKGQGAELFLDSQGVDFWCNR